MSTLSALACQGCGETIADDTPWPFRCPTASPSDDIDHVLRRHLKPLNENSREILRRPFRSPLENPFLRFGRLFHAYWIARMRGLGDEKFARLIVDLDRAVADVAGHGFRVTPFATEPALAARLDLPGESVWIKNETGNVAGSHKARHLMAVLIWMRMVQECLPLATEMPSPLAIASCGNAALAAATLARAVNLPLEVFVPTWVDPKIMELLSSLGARAVSCSREAPAGGDPCYQHFREAIDHGALPFTCQGRENALVLEGGKTLAWEIVSQILQHGRQIDHIVVQVGGGALASATYQGFVEALDLGVIDHLPRFHTVQTLGGSPLHRAWEQLADRIIQRHCAAGGPSSAESTNAFETARFIAQEVPTQIVEDELKFAAGHRSTFMWPWEEEPRSIATGILDDETYDWLAVVEAMLLTGGAPLVVPEELLEQAHTLARETTDIAVEPTGTAGLAGLLQLLEVEEISADSTVALLFTGIER